MAVQYLQITEADQYAHLLQRLAQLELEHWQNVVQLDIANAAGGDSNAIRQLQTNIAQLDNAHANLVARLTAFTASTGLAMPGPTTAVADTSL